MLVEYFVQRYARRAGKNFRSIEKKTLGLFQTTIGQAISVSCRT